MIISDAHKIIYLDPPKTASCTLDHIMLQYAGGYTLKYLDKDYEGKERLFLKHNRKIPPDKQNYTKIATVRNPFSRIISSYYFHIKRGVLHYPLPHIPKKVTYDDTYLDDFIDVSIKLSQWPDDVIDHKIYILFPCSKFLSILNPDIIIHSESIEQDLKQINFLPHNIDIPIINKNEYPLTPITKKRQEKIIQWAEKDFSLYGYSTDIPQK